MAKKFILEKHGLEVELGKFAPQAAGAAWLRQGGTVVLATVCSAESKDFPGFLPLTVDYREQFSAAGKIPGGYLKREGKSTDREILVGRLVDRAIRPLFPTYYFDQVQVLTSVLSVDEKHSPARLSLLASSIALSISNVPFMGPVGIAEVARVDGQWVINPTHAQSQASDVALTVAGTAEGICMVEGCLNQLSEQEVLDIMFMAHDHLKEQVAWQDEIVAAMAPHKDPVKELINWNEWDAHCDNFLTEDKLRAMCIDDKVRRSEAFKKVREEFFAKMHAEIEATHVSTDILDYVFDGRVKYKLTDLFMAEGKRVDGRGFTQVRQISNEVALLPQTHGSALFQRGGTQALVTVTLGGGQDEQRVDDLLEENVGRRFMLHYNFPPFSVGEVKPMRGPGRREIGHGYLANSAIKPVLPAKDDFPYTIRVVSDILASDGSSSMATVCGSTMALMQTGVPVKGMVSGVAMGLLRSSQGKFQALTDINGFEDAFGLMDFKVAGTENGITAIQMDIKYKGGLPKEVFVQALAQANEGRLHILSEMRKVMSKPNEKLSDLVPQIISTKIPVEKIGAVIGSGGKIIKEIIEKTGTNIDIEDDGNVRILGGQNAKLDQALLWVNTLAGNITPGMQFTARIKRFAEFGIFAELVPGVDGLIHVSALPKDKQRTFSKDYAPDQEILVEVADYDKETGRIRLKVVA